jgi:hypothetical protein
MLYQSQRLFSIKYDERILYDELRTADQEVAYFKVLQCYLPARSEENYKNLSQDSQYPGQDLN